MTFTRNEQGEFVKVREVTGKSIIKTAVDASVELIESFANMFHGILNVAIKLGLISLLWPTLKLFVITFYKTLEQIPVSFIPLP